MTTTDKQSQKSIKWLERAMPKASLKKGIRPELNQTFYTADYAFATDGYRIHQCLGSFGPVVELPDELADGVKRAKATARNATTSAVVAPSQLAMLAKQARAFDYGRGFNMRLHFTADGLFAKAISAETGDWESALVLGDTIPHWGMRRGQLIDLAEPVIYQHSGPSVEMAVNPKFLLDALAGMGAEVEIRVRADMLDLQSGDAEAVIMGMHLG